MKLPRDLSGNDLADILCRRFGYERIHQTGSHIILQVESPAHHRVAIPAHTALRLGTLNAILRAVSEVQRVNGGQVLRVNGSSLAFCTGAVVPTAKRRRKKRQASLRDGGRRSCNRVDRHGVAFFPSQAKGRRVASGDTQAASMFYD